MIKRRSRRLKHQPRISRRWTWNFGWLNRRCTSWLCHREWTRKCCWSSHCWIKWWKRRWFWRRGRHSVPFWNFGKKFPNLWMSDAESFELTRSISLSKWHQQCYNSFGCFIDELTVNPRCWIHNKEQIALCLSANDNAIGITTNNDIQPTPMYRMRAFHKESSARTFTCLGPSLNIRSGREGI